MRGLSSEMRAFLNAIATGVLVFLLVETLSKSIEPVEVALEHVTVEGGGTWGGLAARRCSSSVSARVCSDSSTTSAG